MKRIIIRCDASQLIGSGHVMRCRTLARELQRRGGEVIFLCRRQLGDLINLLEPEFPVFALPTLPLASCDAFHGRDLYSAWLGCSQEQDAAQCLEVLGRAGINRASWVVTDHYGLDSCWETQVLSGLAVSDVVPKLLVIDDLADRTHHADIVLDQNFFTQEADQRYQHLVPLNCCQLLGPHYALLGAEYAHFHPIAPIRKDFQRVLVFFGGVDRLNLTSRALEALLAPELADLRVDVVVGHQSPHRFQIEELVSQRPFTVLHEPQSSLAALILRADFAIGAGGSTIWERLCLGLPSLVVTSSENQRYSSNSLHQAGFINYLGSANDVTVENLRNALYQLKEQPMLLCNTNLLTDGWGASRITSSLLGPLLPLRLRLATFRDESLLLRWANDPSVRAQSFSSDMIHPQDHNKWFHAGLISENRLHFIAIDLHDCPLGQIRFDREWCNDKKESFDVVIDISLDRSVRGMGLSKNLLSLGLKSLFSSWGSDFKVIANVLSGNVPSLSAFLSSGFVEDSNYSNEQSSSNRFSRLIFKS